MASRVLADEPLPGELTAMLAADCELLTWPADPAELEPMLDAAGMFTYSHPKIDGALMDRMPNLKVISNFGVGVDHIDVAAATARNIPVGNTPGILDGATADMAFALLLAAGRRLVEGDRYARGPDFHRFDPSFMLGREVHGATLGIVGMGRIGEQVARRARGFDMAVLYHNRRPNPQAEAELGAAYASLPDLLRRADFVALNVPLTSESRGMIGREQLALMKPTAILINTCRGPVVEEKALYRALRDEKILGAGLDVMREEPPQPDHELFSLQNAIFSPHSAGPTWDNHPKRWRNAFDNCERVARGQKPFWIVPELR